MFLEEADNNVQSCDLVRADALSKGSLGDGILIAPVDDVRGIQRSFTITFFPLYEIVASYLLAGFSPRPLCDETKTMLNLRSLSIPGKDPFRSSMVNVFFALSHKKVTVEYLPFS